MRRALILLLVLILPLKAIGAVVVPITGAPHHHHHHAMQAHASIGHEAPAYAHPPAHSACDGMSRDVDADASVIHDHACPHLEMVPLVSVSSLPELDRWVPEIEQHAVQPLHSIVLEILVPPPTLKS
jgi:hypothetical protein